MVEKTILSHLDKFDYRILYELDIDSRQSFQSLAKKVNLSKETTFHRVKKLEERGIIDKYLTILNVHKLGYLNFRLFFKFRNIDEIIESKIINFFKKQEIVGWIIGIEGNWNLGIWFMIKDLFIFKQVYEEFKTKFSQYIVDEKLSLLNDVFYYSRSYLIEKDNEKSFDLIMSEKPFEIEEEDWKILEKIAENSRTPIIDLADYSGLSEKTVIKKINELEKKGIILGYRLKINLERIGVSYYKVHIKLNNLNLKDKREIDAFIFEQRNIIYRDNTLSGYDLELDVQVQNKEEFDKIINNLKEKFKKNIENLDILNYKKEHKHVFLAP
jgi:DNA-binding Lrp family transcriptional regulator